MTYSAPADFHPDIEAIIFDCDGTLADTFAANYRCFREIMAEDGYHFETAFYAERLGLSRPLLLADIEKHHGVHLDDAEIARRAVAAFPKYVPAITAIPYTRDIIHACHGHLKLGIASSNVGPLVRATVTAIGLHDRFETIVTIDDTGIGKPEPDLYLLAARNLSVEPRACHVFEDSDEGMEAAHRAGMRATDIRPFYQSDPTTW